MYFEAIYFTFNKLTSYCLQSYKNVIFKRFWLILPIWSNLLFYQAEKLTGKYGKTFTNSLISKLLFCLGEKNAWAGAI